MRTFGLHGTRRLRLFLSLWLSTAALGQQGMSPEELFRTLESYFAGVQVADLRAQLPLGAPYEIWSWDVGDFSGDGYPDVALTALIPQERQRRVRFYAFVDQDGFLLNVAQSLVPYRETPLEVGVAIRDTLCSVTQKLRNGVWTIRRYRYWRGSFTLWEEQTLETLSGGRSREIGRHYMTLEQWEHLFRLDRAWPSERRALVLPAYHRRHRIVGPYATDALCATVDYVPRGAYYWSGPEDASLRLRAAYDEHFLYLVLWVTDETVISGRCDTCPADRIELWVAAEQPSQSAPTRGRKAAESAPTSWTRAHVSLRLGNFADQLPQLSLYSTHWQEALHRPLWRRMKAVVVRRPSGYTVKLRIPLALLMVSLENVGTTPVRLRFAVEVVDIDNEFRPEEASAVCTSSDFRPEDPSTYAELLLLPPGQWYGESSNILADALLNELLLLGF